MIMMMKKNKRKRIKRRKLKKKCNSYWLVKGMKSISKRMKITNGVILMRRRGNAWREYLLIK